MSRRKTVEINYDNLKAAIDRKFYKNNTIFCIEMGFEGRTSWVSDLKRGRNLPSPEEAARMCLLLNTTPDEILTEPADIELVNGLIAQEREKQGIKKDPVPEGTEVSESKRKLLALVDEMTDEHCDKMYELILAAMKMM